MTYYRHRYDSYRDYDYSWGHDCRDDDNTVDNGSNGAVAESVNWTLQYGDVMVEVQATLDANGNVVFTYDTDAKVDLTGLYVDVDNDGGNKVAANWTDWMVGRDTDGDRLDGFDYAATIGTKWSCDTPTTEGQLTVSMAKLGIDSLADLDGAELAISATVKSSWWCSTTLRLADTGTATYADDNGIDGENIDGYVQMSDSQITELHIVFWNDDYAGDQNGDQYYVVNVTVPAELSEDPDAYLDQLVAALTEADPYIDADTRLKSVIVTEEDGDRINYELEDWANLNGEEPDTLAWTVFHENDHILDEDTNVEGGTEIAYNLTVSGDEFVLA